MKWTLVTLVATTIFLTGCTEEILFLNGGASSGVACSNNDTYCLDIEHLGGNTATEDFSTIYTPVGLNDTYYYNLTST